MSDSSPPLGQGAMHQIQLADEAVDVGGHLVWAVVGVLGVELGDDGFNDVVEDLALVEVVPGVAQDEEVAVVNAAAAVEESAGGEQLEQAHHATV